MAVSYLKKKKMHSIAQELCYEKVPALKDCEYKFYRGSEWLKWFADEECEDGYIQWEFYCCRSYYSFEKVQHLESENKAVTLERYVIRRSLESKRQVLEKIEK